MLEQWASFEEILNQIGCWPVIRINSIGSKVNEPQILSKEEIAQGSKEEESEKLVKCDQAVKLEDPHVTGTRG